jgi:type VI secretion system protein ImpG
MSAFNRYFREEMLALRELGKEFAKRNPALAPCLGTPACDPDVERILEGVAFLAGRLRQKLDDELPEITHSLFSLLWPNYLRPVPACSVIQYRPGANVTGTVFKPRGSRVESIPVQGTRCSFRTVYDTEIHPIHIVDMRVLDQREDAAIALHFKTLGVPLANLPLSRLRFFLTGEPAIADTLYFTLATKVNEIRVVLRDANEKEKVIATLPASCLHPVGFHEEEGVYPYPANTFPGYRILQEYFCFPEKFSFVELSGLEHGLNRHSLYPYQDATEFGLHFMLRDLPEAYESFRLDNWRLFCTPVVNLFTMDASPLVLDQRRTEYRIVPNPRQPDHYAVYSVDHVGTWGQGSRADHVYLPFESFEHEGHGCNDATYYRLRTRASRSNDGTETYVTFMKNYNDALAKKETVSIELTCTNKMLPKLLRVGDININGDYTSDSVEFSNITPVIPSFSPPLEGDTLWRLLSNMSLNYVALTNAHTLRAVLSTYDFRSRHDRPRASMLEKILQSIVDISCSESHRVYKGMPVRGAQTRLVLDQRSFSCEGAMYLFGSVLNEFFAMSATVNSFHQLIVREAVRGEEYKWPARLGRTRTI